LQKGRDWSAVSGGGGSIGRKGGKKPFAFRNEDKKRKRRDALGPSLGEGSGFTGIELVLDVSKKPEDHGKEGKRKHRQSCSCIYGTKKVYSDLARRIKSRGAISLRESLCVENKGRNGFTSQPPMAEKERRRRRSALH